MAVTALYPAALRIGGHYTSLVASSVKAGVQVKDVEKRTFAIVPFMEVVAGLRRFEVSTDAYQDWAAGAADELARAMIGTVQPFSLAPDGDLAGNRALAGRALLKSYKPMNGKVGDIANLALDEGGTGVVGEGLLSLDGATVRTATVNGTGVQLGAVPAGKSVFAACHLTTFGGTITSVTFSLQSDDNVGFTTPTTIATGTALTAVGGTWLQVAGPITDDRFRVVATVVGAAPSYVAAAAIAIA